MTEESDTSKAAPGSGAGDAAPTQAIPRIAKPAKKAPAKAAPKSAPADRSTAGATAATSTETDKGRPRKAAAVAPAADAKSKAKDAADDASTADAEVKDDAAKNHAVKNDAVKNDAVKNDAAKDGAPGSADRKRSIRPSGRPLTAADYARTTQGSPASTSVIPAVKNVGGDAAKPAATLEPVRDSSGRRASLRLTHVEPWSVTRLAFVVSVAMMIVVVVAAIIFWVVLNIVGVWDQINDSFTTVLGDESSSFNVRDYFGLGRVVGLTLVLSAVNVVLTTVLATIAAHLYNLAAQLMGGVEVTFTEDNN